jgi:hypothetical protein
MRASATNCASAGRLSYVACNHLARNWRSNKSRAQQPTTFDIDTYDITTVFDTPSLITSLAEFSEQQLRQYPDGVKPSCSPTVKESLLFLRVQAAADFFSTDKTLMQQPPPVDIDIILDPYVGSIFPQSLGPTAVYLLILAAGSWVLSGKIWQYLYPQTKQHTD